MPQINTGKVRDRRCLWFISIDDALADAERIAAADRACTLRRTGNWTAGQVFGHIAAWIDYPYFGYPFGPPPWFIRVMLRWKKRGYIARGLSPGVRIPGGGPAGTFATEDLTTEEGLHRLRAAFDRLKSNEPVRFHSPAWGPLTYEERVGLNLRHAELHMSFLHPG